MKLLARMTYKLLVTSMIAITLSFFVVTPYSHANKFQDLINDDGFYYTGTQDGNLTVPASMFEKIINALSEIAGYLLGIIGLALRGVGIGWIEIAEMILTSILDTENGFFDVLGSSLDNYSQNVVNVETIIFNRVGILNANIFEEIDADTDLQEKTKEIENDKTLTDEQKEAEKKEAESKAAANGKITKTIRVAVAKWYYVLRLVSIAFMLVLLIFLGIKMALSSAIAEKALTKQMLVDWVVGMILVFSVHYIMLAIFGVNDSLVNALEPLVREGQELPEEYTYGLESKLKTSEMETTLYESARTRAYSLNFVDGFTGMVIYGVLVYYAWRFAIMYFIRVFNIMILTLVAPVIAASYAINKVITGKSKIFPGWLKEYIMTVIIQVFHVIIYASFVSMALKFSMESLPGVIIAFVLLNFMMKADKMLRSLFKLAGGQGSLAGDMENTGFKELKDTAKNAGTLIASSALGKEAMKMTYRVATKPVRVGAEAIFSRHMVKKANEKEEQQRKEINERVELERQQEEAEQELEEIQNRKAELKNKERKLQAERAYYYHQQDEENTNKKTRELQENQAEQEELAKKEEEARDKLEDINDEIEEHDELKRMNDLKKEFEKGTFKGNIKEALFKPENYVEKGRKRHVKALRDKNGNFVLNSRGKKIHEYDDGKYHKMRTLRKGGANYAFWRKKQVSVGKQFAQNFKLAKLFGLSSDSEKELKKEFKFWKNSIMGVATSILGWPAMVINPALGLGLLQDAATAKIDFATRIRTVRNRPSYKKDKRYMFNAFSAGAQYQMQIEAERQIREAQSRMAHRVAAKHPKLAERILKNKSITYKAYTGVSKRFKRWLNTPSGISTIQQENVLRINQMEFRKRFKDELKDLNEMQSQMIQSDYKRKFRAEEKSQQTNAERMSDRELAFADKKSNDNVAQVGRHLFEVDFHDDCSKKQEEFLEDIERIEQEPQTPREEKIRRMKIQIKQKKDDLIENQMTKYFADNGVIDISNTKLDTKDVVKIKENVLGVLENKGIIKKGEIKLEDNLISSDNVKNVFVKLKNEKQQTNEILEQKMATSTCLEYMEQNNIQDVRRLQTNQAKEGIFAMIKNKMLSEDSKKAAEVIQRISGRDKVREAIQLSDFMKQAVDEVTDNVQEANVTGAQNRKKLEERESNRKINEVKMKLEEAICTDDSQNIQNEKQLEMLFLLSELGQKNVKAEQLAKKPTKIPIEVRNKVEDYQQKYRQTMTDGSTRLNRNRDGSRRWDENRDGSQKVMDDIKINGLAKILYGPSQNIIDLINYV